MGTYSYRVSWSDADAGYVAISPEFPNLSGFGGEDEIEAVRQLKEAIAAALEIHEAEGWPIPEPQRVPEHSGQFRLRLPKSLHAQLALRADDEGVSLNTLVLTYLAQAVSGGVSAAVTARPVTPSQEFSFFVVQGTGMDTKSVQGEMIYPLKSLTPQESFVVGAQEGGSRWLAN